MTRRWCCVRSKIYVSLDRTFVRLVETNRTFRGLVHVFAKSVAIPTLDDSSLYVVHGIRFAKRQLYFFLNESLEVFLHFF